MGKVDVRSIVNNIREHRDEYDTQVNLKKVEVVVNAENVGFRAGDVYNALAVSEKPLTVAEIAKKAKITVEETYLGIGWLLKEGKAKGEENKISLA